MNPRPAAPTPVRERGAVLINALVIMALLAGTAAMLQLNTQTRIQQAQTRVDAVQGGLYLDSAMALAALALRLDEDLTSTDHLGEDWARRNIVVPIDRGVISVELTDLQGRFNVNMLADPSDPFGARVRFARLISRLELPERAGRDIIAAVEAAGALIAPEALTGISALSAGQRRVLAEHTTMLPGTLAYNLNTAPRALLASLIPQIPEDSWEEFESQRAAKPFEDISLFEALLTEHLTQEELAEVNLRRFDVRSAFFAVQATVLMDDLRWSRHSWLERGTDAAGQTTVRRIYQARVY